MKRTLFVRLTLTLVALIVLAVAGFILWASSPAALQAEAQNVLVGDDALTVVQDAWLAFIPEGAPPTVGVIFYPGGRVAANAYAPIVRAVSETTGALGVITPMPLNLAVFNPEAADAVQAAYPEVTRWIIAGHSLGGAMAARYAHDNADRVAGVVLLAAYPEESKSLAALTVPVVSISASEDRLATPDDIAATRPLLPTEADVIVIEGGNHAYFGSYGEQSGDGTATVTRDAQQAIVIDAMAALVREIAAR
jgi:predicted esterase